MFCLLSSIPICTRSQHGSMWLRYGCDFFCQVCGSRVCNDWTPIGEEWCVQLWCCVAWAPFWEKASWLHPTSWGWEHNSLGKFKTFVLRFVGNHSYAIWSSCIDSGCRAKNCSWPRILQVLVHEWGTKPGWTPVQVYVACSKYRIPERRNFWLKRDSMHCLWLRFFAIHNCI